MGLNAKQKLFVDHYVIDRNATQAAIAAGYSKKSAASIGPRLTEHVEVRAAIEKKLNKLNAQNDLTAEMVLAELKKLAFVDLSDAYDDNGDLLHPKKMPEAVRKSLNAVETIGIYRRKKGKRVRIGRTEKIKLADKVRSLEMLAKHFKLLTEVQQISGPNGGPQVVFHAFANGSEAPVEPEPPKPDEKK